MTTQSGTGPVGLAVIGAGGFGQGMADRISVSEKLRLVSCYDPVEEMAAKTADKFGCAVATIDEIMADDSVEGVVVTSPNFAHRENTVAAAAAGKHVFVDKPIANTIEDGYAMIDSCRKAGVILTVGHNFRRFGSQRKLKKLVDKGVPGTVISVEANFSHSGGMGLTPEQWRWYPEKAPALPLIQLGLHCIDTIQHVLGPIEEVTSFMGHRAIPADNVDVTATALRFESGVVGYVGSNYATPPIHYVNIYGTDANLYCIGNQVKIVRGGKQPEEVVQGEDIDDRLEELEEFGACIRTGGQPEVTGEAGLRALAVVLAALKSSQERRPVTLEELLAR